MFQSFICYNVTAVPPAHLNVAVNFVWRGFMHCSACPFFWIPVSCPLFMFNLLKGYRLPFICFGRLMRRTSRNSRSICPFILSENVFGFLVRASYLPTSKDTSKTWRGAIEVARQLSPQVRPLSSRLVDILIALPPRLEARQ